jgi:hypothetical protein
MFRGLVDTPRVTHLRLTESSIKALHASAGQTITGVFVPESPNRKLEKAPGFLAIALANGTVLNLYPTSTPRSESSSAEYFRLDIEPGASPLVLENCPGDLMKWTISGPVMRALTGDAIREVQVVQEQIEDEGIVDVGVRFVTSREFVLYISAEQAELPMTLAIELDGNIANN